MKVRQQLSCCRRDKRKWKRRPLWKEGGTKYQKRHLRKMRLNEIIKVIIAERKEWKKLKK